MKKATVAMMLLSLIILPAISSATTYYVSELLGDDNNDGMSEVTPFATIQKAADVMVAGDMVIVDFGEYHETIVPKNNGTAGNPIIYMAKEQGEAEIFTGETAMLPTFTLHSGSIYVMEDVFRTVNKVSEGGTPLIKKDHLDSLVAASFFQDRMDNKLYVWSSDNADPATHADTVFFEMWSFDIVEGSNITIDGFVIKNGIIAIVAANDVALPGLIIQNNVLGNDELSSTAIQINGGEADTLHTYESFLIDNNIFELNSVIKIYNAGRNSMISDNVFNGDPAAGQVGYQNISVEGSTNYPGAQCQGLVIERNFFNNNNARCMYIRNGEMEDIKILNNIFYKGFFNTLQVRNATNVDVINNTFFFGGASHLARFESGVTGHVYNNIIANTRRSYTLFFDNSNDDSLLIAEDYNYFVGDTSLTSSPDNQTIRTRKPFNSSSVTGGPHDVYGHPLIAQKDTLLSIFGDTLYVEEIPDMLQPAYPLFVNPDTLSATPENFLLAEGSNARDVAFADVAPKEDFFGNLRDDKPDMGAIEFGAGVAVEKILKDMFPQEYSLSQNYPNPFNPETTIEYQLPRSGKVQLMVFNILGQKVATLYDGFQKMGTHHVKWNGLDDKGNAVPSGLYLYRLKMGSITKTAKMMLLK
jgi:hypothetical protein